MLLPDEDLLTLAAAILAAGDAQLDSTGMVLRRPAAIYVQMAADLQLAARDYCADRLAQHHAARQLISSEAPAP